MTNFTHFRGLLQTSTQNLGNDISKILIQLYIRDWQYTVKQNTENYITHLNQNVNQIIPLNHQWSSCDSLTTHPAESFAKHSHIYTPKWQEYIYEPDIVGQSSGSPFGWSNHVCSIGGFLYENRLISRRMPTERQSSTARLPPDFKIEHRSTSSQTGFRATNFRIEYHIRHADIGYIGHKVTWKSWRLKSSTIWQFAQEYFTGGYSHKNNHHIVVNVFHSHCIYFCPIHNKGLNTMPWYITATYLVHTTDDRWFPTLCCIWITSQVVLYMERGSETR